MSETRIAVFLGPSCPEAEARQHLPHATYFAPAARGSVYTIINDGYDAIILIDGLFYASLAVWHKEIMFALSSGIAVIGASSMGALRAAELQGTGMAGVGTIFEWYRDGVIDGDDEVALLHEGRDENYTALTIPLVNLRWQLREAVERTVITRGQEAQIIASAKRLCFTDRSLSRILESLQDELDVAGLTAWLERSGEDLKKSDAIAALTYARDLQPGPARTVGVEFELMHINVGIEYFSTERMTSIQAKSAAGGTSLATLRQHAEAEASQFGGYLKARAYERLIVGWGRELRLEPAGDDAGEATGWSADAINAEHRRATGLTLVDIAREHRDAVLCRSLKEQFCRAADYRHLAKLDRAVHPEAARETLDWCRLAVLDGRLIYTLWALGKQKGVVPGLLASRAEEAPDSVERIMRFAAAVDRTGPSVFGYAFDPAREIVVLRQYLHRLETPGRICA